MRTWGRITVMGVPQWVEVSTDANGSNDYVWLTTLVQTLKLNLNESPFYANFGIPAQPSVVQQVFPDYYVALTQKFFSQFFASLIVAKQPLSTPTYNINATLNNGTKVQETIAT